jgi:hypothetical protein
MVLMTSIFGLFQVKFHVQSLSNDITELNVQLKHERESLHVLKAEWTYLNKPERLKQLSDKYLSLNKVNLKQIHKMESKLPLYLVEDKDKRDLYLATLDLMKSKNKDFQPKSNTELTSNVKSAAKSPPLLTKVKY